MATSHPPAVVGIRRRAGYGDGILTRLSDMKKSSSFTDFTIIVQQHSIACHKNVLAAASSYFESMFLSRMEETVTDDTFRYEVVDKVVSFMYGDKIEIEFDANFKEYVEIAQKLLLNDLTKELEQFIVKQINPGNCIQGYVFSEKYNFNDGKEKAKQIMLSHFPGVSESSDFVQLSFEDLIGFLRELPDVNSDQLVQSAITWILHDKTSRQKHFPDILNNVKVEKCSPKFLMDLRRKYRRDFNSDLGVLDRITEGILSQLVETEGQHSQADTRERQINKTCLAVGGWAKKAQCNLRCIQVDIINSTITEKTTFPQPIGKIRAAYCSSSLGWLVLGGGITEDPLSATAECYLIDHISHAPSQLKPLSSSAYGAGAVCIDDVVYVMGGENGREDIMECLDLYSRKWTRCPNMLQKVRYPIATTVGTKIYVLFNTVSANNGFRLGKGVTLQCYSTQTRNWSFAPDMPAQIQNTNGSCAVSIRDQVYIVGGPNKLCARYDTTHDTWSLLSQPSEMHRYGCAVSVGDSLVLTGGWDESGSYTDSIEIYSTTNDKWERSSLRLPTALGGHFCYTL